MALKDDPVALGGLSKEYTMDVVRNAFGNEGGNQPVLTRAQTMIETSSRKSSSNSLAPFATVGKPTCGYFFSRETDNRKKKIGIPPSDLVKWRHFSNTQS